MSLLDHIILFSYLFFLFFYWGKQNYKTSSFWQFWTSALLPMFSYSLIVGSRYGWVADYMGYKYRFEDLSYYPDEQIGFRWLNYFIDSVGLNYVGGYIVYSLIFIVCSFILIRSYGKDSKYMYAFVIPSTLIFISGIIRQGISFSFLLLAIYFLNKRKWAGV